MPSPEKLSDIKGILSEPLLPQQGPPSSTGSEPRRSTRPKVARPASFPFSQAELLSDARVELEGGEGEKDLMETLRNAYERLEFTNLSDYTSTGLQLQVEKFQRVRQVELTVPAAGPSWKQAAVTIATTLIGAGVLGLPYAMRKAGWFGFLLMMLSTIVASFTAKQLVWSFNTVNERKLADPEKLLGKGFVRTYDQLAEELLGERGGAAMQVLTVLECYGCAVCYVVLHAVNWPHVLHLPETVVNGVPAPVACVTCWACLVLPLLLVRPRFLSYFAFIGLVAVTTLFVVNALAPALAGYPLAPTSTCIPLDETVSKTDVSGERQLIETDGIGIATGLILFCFGGHATFPELYAQMSAEDRPHFDRSLTVGCAIAGLFYLLFGGMSYFYFGGWCARGSSSSSSFTSSTSSTFGFALSLTRFMALTSRVPSASRVVCPQPGRHRHSQPDGRLALPRQDCNGGRAHQHFHDLPRLRHTRPTYPREPRLHAGEHRGDRGCRAHLRGGTLSRVDHAAARFDVRAD